MYAFVPADSIDLGEETMSGAGTTHHTNMMIVQKCVPGNQDDDNVTAVNETIRIPKRRHTVIAEPVEIFPSVKERRIDSPTVEKHTTPPMNSDVDVSVEDYRSITKTSLQTLDHLYFIVKTLDSDDTLPNWTGFFTQLGRISLVIKDKIGYLPIILDAPRSPRLCTPYILQQTLKVANELSLPTVVGVYDVAIYQKIQEIRWGNAASIAIFGVLHERVVPRSGEFQTCMAIVGVIGPRLGDAGLQKILPESQVVAQGNHYNRALAAHKCVVEAIETLRIEAFLSSLDVREAEDMKDGILELAQLFSPLLYCL